MKVVHRSWKSSHILQAYPAKKQLLGIDADHLFWWVVILLPHMRPWSGLGSPVFSRLDSASVSVGALSDCSTASKSR